MVGLQTGSLQTLSRCTASTPTACKKRVCEGHARMTPPSPWRARTCRGGRGAALAAALIVLWLVAGRPAAWLAKWRKRVDSRPPHRARAAAYRRRRPVCRWTHHRSRPFLTPDLRYQIEAMLLDAGDATTPEELKLRLSQLVQTLSPIWPPGAGLAERYVDYRVALGTLKAPGRTTHGAAQQPERTRASARALLRPGRTRGPVCARISAGPLHPGPPGNPAQHRAHPEEKSPALKDAEAELPPEQRADRAPCRGPGRRGTNARL